MDGNSLSLGGDLDAQVHEANISPQNFNPKWFSPRHIIIKLSKIKDKEKFLKQWEKNNFSHIRKLL